MNVANMPDRYENPYASPRPVDDPQQSRNAPVERRFLAKVGSGIYFGSFFGAQAGTLSGAICGPLTIAVGEFSIQNRPIFPPEALIHVIFSAVLLAVYGALVGAIVGSLLGLLVSVFAGSSSSSNRRRYVRVSTATWAATPFIPLTYFFLVDFGFGHMGIIEATLLEIVTVICSISAGVAGRSTANRIWRIVHPPTGCLQEMEKAGLKTGSRG